MPERTRPPASAQDDAPVASLADTSTERGYDEKQVAEILQRAAGLEQKKRLERPVLTLAEIETIARDAGIDPAMVRQAARDLAHARQGHSLGSRFAGAPLRRTYERVLDGELTAEDHEVLAADIRNAFSGLDLSLQIAALGRSLSVNAHGHAARVDVQVVPKAGKTHVLITVDASRKAGGLFSGLMGGLGGGLGGNVAWIVPTTLATQYHAPVVACAAAGAAAFLGVVAGTYGLARTIFTRTTAPTLRRMEQLADTLEGHLRESLARR